MIKINIKSSKFICDIEIEHKISIFIGNSGVGKTVFANSFDDRHKNSYTITKSEPIDIVKISESNWRYILDGSIDKRMLYIVDDEDFVYTEDFVSVFNKTRDCYLIIITRAISNEKQSMLSISDDSTYEFKSDGIYHKNVHVNKLNERLI